MTFIFENIIKDLSQIGFFSKYKFRKRDASFLLKTKGGKYIIELDHWMDETTSSLVIYPIYGIRFDILHKWFEKFSIKSLQDQSSRRKTKQFSSYFRFPTSHTTVRAVPHTAVPILDTIRDTPPLK